MVFTNRPAQLLLRRGRGCRRAPGHPSILSHHRSTVVREPQDTQTHPWHPRGWFTKSKRPLTKCKEKSAERWLLICQRHKGNDPLKTRELVCILRRPKASLEEARQGGMHILKSVPALGVQKRADLCELGLGKRGSVSTPTPFLPTHKNTTRKPLWGKF